MGGVCVCHTEHEREIPAGRAGARYFLIFFCLEVFLHITADPPKPPSSRHRDIERKGVMQDRPRAKRGKEKERHLETKIKRTAGYSVLNRRSLEAKKHV
jgi:hypothetical protein